MFENLSEKKKKKTPVNHKTYFDVLKVLQQQQADTSYCIASWESFLSNSWYFFEIAAPIRTETLVYHNFRLLHNTLLLSILCQ